MMVAVEIERGAGKERYMKRSDWEVRLCDECGVLIRWHKRKEKTERVHYMYITGWRRKLITKVGQLEGLFKAGYNKRSYNNAPMGGLLSWDRQCISRSHF